MNISPPIIEEARAIITLGESTEVSDKTEKLHSKGWEFPLMDHKEN